MPTLRDLLLAGLGGFLGSASRYLVGSWVQRASPLIAFPLGTLVVNVSGCFCIGLLGGLAEARHLLSPGLFVFLVVGVLGGFTTFSSFAYETLTLARDGEPLRALVNVVAQVALGLTAAWLGSTAVRAW